MGCLQAPSGYPPTKNTNVDKLPEENEQHPGPLKTEKASQPHKTSQQRRQRVPSSTRSLAVPFLTPSTQSRSSQEKPSFIWTTK